MKKEEVIKRINELKGRPIEIGLADEGAMLYAGIEGHWLFVEGDNLVEIKPNACDGTYGFDTVSQQQNPFIITRVQFDTVNYVRSYFGKTSDDIKNTLSTLVPVGTDQSISDIEHDLQTNTIRKAHSTAGYSNPIVQNDDSPYGRFPGTAITTSIDGFKGYPTR